MIRIWKSASLRSQLVAIMCVLMVATVALTCVLTASLLRNNLVQRIDEDLRNNKDAVALFLGRMGDGFSESSAQSILRFYGVLMNNDGGRIRYTATASPDEDIPQISDMPIQEVIALHGGSFQVDGSRPDSKGWLVQAYQLNNGQGSVALALPLSSVDETVERATALIFTVGMLVTAVATGIAYLVVSRSFRPLGRVEKTAAAIAAGDLSRRVEVVNPDTEVGRLSRSLNAMLAHIESAFSARAASERKMRRFVQDASHELRTPLVTIRGFSELYRHGGLQTPEDVGAAMGRIESEAKRMGQLVEDLLTLARIDEQRPLEQKPLDLLLLGNDAALDARVGAPGRSIRVIGLDGGAPRPAPTVGDEARLRQVVSNLVTNALRYTPEGSPIEIAVGTQAVIDDRLDSVLEVRDHGPGISGEDATRVFERFYRADSSRQRETGGTGLGLAIVAALVAQHDGSVRLSETPGGGATMSIRLPYSPDQDSSFHRDELADEDVRADDGGSGTGH